MEPLMNTHGERDSDGCPYPRPVNASHECPSVPMSGLLSSHRRIWIRGGLSWPGRSQRRTLPPRERDARRGTGHLGRHEQWPPLRRRIRACCRIQFAHRIGCVHRARVGSDTGHLRHLQSPWRLNLHDPPGHELVRPEHLPVHPCHFRHWRRSPLARGICQRLIPHRPDRAHELQRLHRRT